VSVLVLPLSLAIGKIKTYMHIRASQAKRVNAYALMDILGPGEGLDGDFKIAMPWD
jgi:hypothetical protein